MKAVNAIPGRNSPVLNFADPLPNPLTDRFTIVNGKQPYTALHKDNIVPRAFPEKKMRGTRKNPGDERLTQGLLFLPSPSFLNGKIKDGGHGNTYTERQLPPTLKIRLY